MLTILEKRREALAFIATLVLYALYAAAYIYRTSFVIDGVRHFALFDDGMISMRFAKNLALGHGLAWNAAGPRVEGFTNPLWTLMMAAVHLLPVPESKTSLIIQIIGALLLGANLVVVRNIAREITGNRSVHIGAVVLTAFYLPLNTWGLQGMEVSALALIVTLAAYITMKNMRTGRFSSVPYLLLGASTLIRIDMAVPALVLMGFLAWHDRPRAARHIAVGLGILLPLLALQTGLRFWYYGELLPNTYYLKMTGTPLYLRLARGMYIAAKFIVTMNPIPFLLPFLFLRRIRTRGAQLLLLLFSAQIAYSIYVGGDAWDWWGGSNRYIAIAIPCFFVMLAYALAEAGRIIANIISNSRGTSPIIERCSFGVVLLASIIAVNLLDGYKSMKALVLIQEPLCATDNARSARLAYALRSITTPQASVAVCAAGVLPYYLDRPMIDILGKCDKRVAHEPAHIVATKFPGRLVDFFPGHRKWDYPYSIGALHPDVVIKVWDGFDVARPILASEYIITESGGITFYVRRGSPNVMWSRVDTTQQATLQPDRSGLVEQM